MSSGCTRFRAGLASQTVPWTAAVAAWVPPSASVQMSAALHAAGLRARRHHHACSHPGLRHDRDLQFHVGSIWPRRRAGKMQSRVLNTPYAARAVHIPLGMPKAQTWVTSVTAQPCKPDLATTPWLPAFQWPGPDAGLSPRCGAEQEGLPDPCRAALVNSSPGLPHAPPSRHCSHHTLMQKPMDAPHSPYLRLGPGV